MAQVCNFIKKETLAQVFSSGFCKISKNTFFTEHLWATASVSRTHLRDKFFTTMKFTQMKDLVRKQFLFGLFFNHSENHKDTDDLEERLFKVGWNSQEWKSKLSYSPLARPQKNQRRSHLHLQSKMPPNNNLQLVGILRTWMILISNYRNFKLVMVLLETFVYPQYNLTPWWIASKYIERNLDSS